METETERAGKPGREARSRHPFWPDDYCRCCCCCCFCSLSLSVSVSLWVSRKMKGTWLIHDRPSCGPFPRTPATLLHAQQPELIVVVGVAFCCCSFWSLQATPFECAESKWPWALLLNVCHGHGRTTTTTTTRAPCWVLLPTWSPFCAGS